MSGGFKHIFDEHAAVSILYELLFLGGTAVWTSVRFLEPFYCYLLMVLKCYTVVNGEP